MNLKEWRKDKGLSQTELAQALEKSAAEKSPDKPRKLRQRTLSGWESGALPRKFWLTIIAEFTKTRSPPTIFVSRRPVARNQEHTALINLTLTELAKAGYCSWPNQTGVWFEHDNQADDGKGRPHKYGKKGSGDIFCVLPPHGRHAEFEGKVGKDTQRKSQKIHQEFVVERNGGLYILFRSAPELLEKLKAAGY